MTIGSGCFVFFIELDGLVSFTSNESRSSLIESCSKDSILGLQRTGLDHGLNLLITESTLPVPEIDRPIVCTRCQHVVLVQTQGIDDTVVSAKILHELAFGELPLFDVVGRGRGEGELRGVDGHCPHGLLVVGENCGAGTLGKVPETDGAVHGTGEDLWVDSLASNGGYRVGVTSEDVDLGLGTYVPDSGSGVSASGDKDVEGGVDGQAVDTGEVTVVVSDDLVVLEIPALDLLVFSTGEEVGIAGTDTHSTNSGNVSSESQSKGTCGKVPHFDGSICGSSDKPFVTDIDCDTSDPTRVTTNDSV